MGWFKSVEDGMCKLSGGLLSLRLSIVSKIAASKHITLAGSRVGCTALHARGTTST